MSEPRRSGRDHGNSRDPEELKRRWLGWHQISPPYRKDYVRFVELSNKGAKEMGFKDTGAMWRSKYDMEPDAFAAEMERLWQQVKPLYDSLYTYTRRKLSEKYGKEVVAADRPIPAHLLGNMWAQKWGNIYPLLAPARQRRSRLRPDADTQSAQHRREADGSVTAKAFFTSLGFEPLPPTFWERSMFTKPADREVVCHASAWDIDYEKDVRLKMCIQINEEDFITVHHELGHNYYQMAYAGQPFLFRDSANDGFHEAIGDTMALSVTPPYLKQLGLIDKVPDRQRRHRIPAESRARQGRVSAVWLSGGSVALESFFGRGRARRLQQSVVGLAREVSGRRAAGAAQRTGFRSRREVSRAGEHAVRALLPRGDSAVSVSSRAVSRGGLQWPALPVLDLRQQEGRREAEGDAGDGLERAVAGSVESDDRRRQDGRDRDHRLLRAA